MSYFIDLQSWQISELKNLRGYLSVTLPVSNRTEGVLQTLDEIISSCEEQASMCSIDNDTTQFSGPLQRVARIGRRSLYCYGSTPISEVFRRITRLAEKENVKTLNDIDKQQSWRIWI